MSKISVSILTIVVLLGLTVFRDEVEAINVNGLLTNQINDRQFQPQPLAEVQPSQQQQQQYRNQPQSYQPQESVVTQSVVTKRESVRFTDKCRPDQVIVDSSSGNCTQLSRSISDTIRDILENSDSTLSLSHYHLGDGSVPVPDHVPVSDLFVQNLAVISETNMSDCLAISACVEHCWTWPERTKQQQAYEEDVVSKFALPELLAKSKDDSTDSDGGVDNGSSVDDEAGIVSGLDFVNTIMSGSKKGIDLAKSNVSRSNRSQICGKCFQRQTEPKSPNCNAHQYGYTIRINAIYRHLIEKNVTLYNRIGRDAGTASKITPEILYYHYSMRFLDIANLTDCFARVSCEQTCDVYQQSLSGLDENDRQSKNIPDPPPPSPSPFANLSIDIEKPKAIDTIHSGSMLGYKLAIEQPSTKVNVKNSNNNNNNNNSCAICQRQYRNCAPDKYQIARASVAIFG